MKTLSHGRATGPSSGNNQQAPAPVVRRVQKQNNTPGTNFEINKDKITHSEPPNFDRNHDCMHAVASEICSVLFFFNTIALIL